jgi:hypothetical protein
MADLKLKPWPLYGYAPGNYQCKCVTCEKIFEGDKRASRCLECAALTANAALSNRRADEAVKNCVSEALEGALACLRHTHDRLIEYPEFETLRLTINAECRKIKAALSPAPSDKQGDGA